MAILQKLETSYLAILRFVIIVISGILLAATLVLLATALADIREEATSGPHSPKVEPERIITELTKTQPKPDVPTAESPAQAVQKQTDPNHADYERAADTIASFVSKYGRGRVISKDDVSDILKYHAETQPTPELMKAYASGLPKIFEKVLSDRKVIELVSRPIWQEPSVALPHDNPAVGRSPLWVVDTLLGQHRKMFKAQIKQAAENEEKERVAKAVRKEEAMQNLYLAAAAFSAFLMLALLSIIVRIERNLRPLAHLADKPGVAG